MTQDSKKPVFTVGLGASAGGLAPLKAFVQTLPEKPGMAFIIIQHLDPTHESMLPEILARECKIPVKNAQTNQTVEANTVYVIPPDAYLAIENGVLELQKPEAKRGFRKAIDHFFRSLAYDCGNRCAAIVLSGSGSDGTAGLRAVRAAGGLAVVQSPEEAEHDSMPESALDANVADKSLAVSGMYALLKHYAQHPELHPARDQSQEQDSPDESLEAIAVLLRTHEKFDLTQYKPSTVQRRIARRMSLTDNRDFPSYLQLLRDSEEERKRLTSELLINVTDFFRDPEAYETLENKIIPGILNNLKKGEDIRIWVAGCASGEEAYSIAILFLEGLSKRQMTNELKIFATDIDEHAIKIARRGVYPDSITAEIPEPYLNKYFIRIEKDHHYRIKSHVRELISFATQNVVSDPPFNHMHLISCRNLLIYLNKEVQEKVLGLFYFALTDHHYLFLGSSESLGQRSHLFKTLNKKWRFYQKLPGGMPHHVSTSRPSAERQNSTRGLVMTGSQSGSRPSASSRSESFRRAILTTQAPATIIVNQDGEVLYNHGDLEAFCTIPGGEPRNDLIQLLRPYLRSRTRSAFYKVKKSKEPVTFYCEAKSPAGRDRMAVCARIVPVQDQDFTDGMAYTISFVEEPLDPHNADAGLTLADENRANGELEKELVETREELQNTIEELETSTEELKASHEEALSTNEELQSSNEELEASSEELRSLNEELSTVNSQLKEKIDQLQRARDDVQNFFSSTDIPTIFLDVDLRVQKYTPAAAQLLGMEPRDYERHVTNVGGDLIDQELVKDCEEVLRTFQPSSKEIRNYRGRWFTRQVTLYRTEDRRVGGVVLVFQDISTIKALSQRAASREAQQAVVAKLGLLALSGSDPLEMMQQATTQVAHVLDADYCKVLKYQPEQGNLLMVAGVGWDNHVRVGEATVPDEAGSQAGYTLRAKEPVVVEDLSKEKRFAGPTLLTSHGVMSGISCLINHSTPPYGVLGVHSREPRQYTEDDANFLQSVANMLSTAIRSKAAQEKISRSEERLNMAREAANIGIHDFDVRSNTIYWDENHRKMWGVPMDLEPITFEVFEGGLHPDDRQRVISEVMSALRKPGTYEWRFRVIDHQDRSVRNIVGKGRVVHAQGEAVRIVGTVQDVTARVEMDRSLQQAIDHLRESDERKNQFLSILGHELRNPLAALANGVAVVERHLSGGERILDIMNHSVDTMKKLLDDLLDLNRVSDNKIELNKVSVNVAHVLEYVIEQTQNQCQKKQQNFRFNAERDLWVRGDPTRLEQVFINLLFNSCKYTPPGGDISLKASYEKGAVCVVVSDTGLGLEESNLEKVFEPFYQIKPDMEAEQGLGIGLALSRNLVELHGGTITAESAGPDLGSTFTVTLPSHRRERDIKEPETPTAPTPLPGRKVLFIDDNESMLAIMPMLLESLDCSVETARTGEDGIEKARHLKPDTIILDIGLPGMNGHQVAQTLRNEGFEGLIVALSGYSHKESRDKSRSMGIDYHLAKPSNLKEISEVLTAGRQRDT